MPVAASADAREPRQWIILDATPGGEVMTVPFDAPFA
jgi:hypothetical protein